MDSHEDAVREKIMKRVYRVHAMKRVTNPALRFGVFAALLFILFNTVSVPTVFLHAVVVGEDVLGAFAFLLRAALKTEPTVQVLLISLFTLCAWSVVDEVRRFRFHRVNS